VRCRTSYSTCRNVSRLLRGNVDCTTGQLDAEDGGSALIIQKCCRSYRLYGKIGACWPYSEVVGFDVYIDSVHRTTKLKQYILNIHRGTRNTNHHYHFRKRCISKRHIMMHTSEEPMFDKLSAPPRLIVPDM
jgi:hypothetical protein